MISGQHVHHGRSVPLIPLRPNVQDKRSKSVETQYDRKQQHNVEDKSLKCALQEQGRIGES